MSESGAESSDADVMSEGTIVLVKLTKSDIPGVSLSDPFEKHTILELKWWLLCHMEFKCPVLGKYLKLFIIYYQGIFVFSCLCSSINDFNTLQNPWSRALQSRSCKCWWILSILKVPEHGIQWIIRIWSWHTGCTFDRMGASYSGHL